MTKSIRQNQYDKISPRGLILKVVFGSLIGLDVEVAVFDVPNIKAAIIDDVNLCGKLWVIGVRAL